MRLITFAIVLPLHNWCHIVRKLTYLAPSVSRYIIIDSALLPLHHLQASQSSSKLPPSFFHRYAGYGDSHLVELSSGYPWRIAGSIFIPGNCRSVPEQEPNPQLAPGAPSWYLHEQSANPVWQCRRACVMKSSVTAWRGKNCWHRFGHYQASLSSMLPEPFSIIFISGDCAGHPWRTLIFFPLRNFIVDTWSMARSSILLKNLTPLVVGNAPGGPTTRWVRFWGQIWEARYLALPMLPSTLQISLAPPYWNVTSNHNLSTSKFDCLLGEPLVQTGPWESDTWNGTQPTIHLKLAIFCCPTCPTWPWRTQHSFLAVSCLERVSGQQYDWGDHCEQESDSSSVQFLTKQAPPVAGVHSSWSCEADQQAVPSSSCLARSAWPGSVMDVTSLLVALANPLHLLFRHIEDIFSRRLGLETLDDQHFGFLFDLGHVDRSNVDN